MAVQGSKFEFSLSFLQPERIERSLTIICDYAGKPDGSFWSAISTLQHADLNAISSEDNILEVWYEGPTDKFAGALGSLMGDVNAREVATPYAASIRSSIQLAFRRTLNTFSQRFPATSAIFHKVIHHVVFARRKGYTGGTVSNRIGLIWLSPESEWTEELWLENVLHEFVHNALFVEDMVHRLLVAGGDRLEQPDALTTSAIRQVKRGYDKAYHSAFVSFTLVEMYHAFGQSNLAKPFLAPLIVCLDDLVAQRHFATPRGQELLLELAETVLPIYQQDNELRSAA